MTLQDEIDARTKEIQTDGYPMSIGELVNIYDDKELDIHPEFQRFFRWTQLQKTRLIESILLGIPLPSIFVAQRSDGVWDVVDGLQRLSTIFEFVGVLRDDKGRRLSSSRLLSTKYLPSLEGKFWQRDNNGENSLTNAQRLIIKRSKLDIKIIKRESDPSAKYELFQRLNTLGSSLTAQEIRNCLLIMVEPSFHDWLLKLASTPSFQTTVSASDKQIEEQYDLELVLRFLALTNTEDSDLSGIRELGEFLTDYMLEAAQDPEFNRSDEEARFISTFNILDEAIGPDAFRRYASSKFLGGFLVSSFETIAVGVGANVAAWENTEPNDRSGRLRQKVTALWSNTVFQVNSGSGMNAKRRIPKLVPLGRREFRP